MHRAFKSIDLDRSGRISGPELGRALKFWNIPKDAIEQASTARNRTPASQHARLLLPALLRRPLRLLTAGPPAASSHHLT